MPLERTHIWTALPPLKKPGFFIDFKRGRLLNHIPPEPANQINHEPVSDFRVKLLDMKGHEISRRMHDK